jgi:hypothetical protein
MGKVSFWNLQNANFSLGAFFHFGGQLGHFVVQGPKIKLYSWEICHLRRLQNSNFTAVTFAHFLGPLNPTPPFVCPNSNFTLVARPFGEVPKLKFYSGGFCHFWGPLVHFGVQGCQKFRLIIPENKHNPLDKNYLIGLQNNRQT